MNKLTRATDTSYRVANPTAIADMLMAAGYQREPAGHPAIIAKLRNRGSVIVVYHTGSVVLGGLDLRAGHTAIRKVGGYE